jgi:hypothetical protein
MTADRLSFKATGQLANWQLARKEEALAEHAANIRNLYSLWPVASGQLASNPRKE